MRYFVNSPFYFFCCLLLLVFSVNGNAADLSPFKAKYNVYRGDAHVAAAKFNLQLQNGVWVWTMKTKPIGLYRWLTQKRPFAQTKMMDTANGLRLLLQHKGDYADKPPRESSWFDLTHKIIYYKKGSRIKQLNLPDGIFNYHSIHLAYPMMLEKKQQQLKINFYKRGKLLKSTLTLEKQLEIPYESSTLMIDKITQEFDQLDRKIIYYYQGESLAPLKIEQIKKDGSSTVMWRMSVK